jgi:D-3-phosphoglycerate dehydrogenase
MLQGSAVCRAAADETPTILVAEKLGQGGVDLLATAGNVDCSYDLPRDQLLEKIKSVDAIVIRSGTKVDREVFEASGGRLKVVGRAGVGIDNVDLAAASETGCLVVNAPTANTVAAAEHGIALLCSLARNIPQADVSMKAGRWDRSKYVGVSMVGKTLAIMGFGKVGGEVARRAKGLGMTVIAHDPYASEERANAIGVKLVSFDEALASGDFFSLHMPLTPDTKGLFGDDAFAKIKKGARIINVARGGVIDDAALARALDAGTVAGAALDVFDPEPPAADHPLVGRPDVICTPHLGASTKEAQEEVAYEIAEAVMGAMRGELTSSVVNAPMVAPEVLKELQPYVNLSTALGRAAVQLVSDHGFSEIEVSYTSGRGSNLDTRLLRAMVVKGILEQITTSQVNIVNADLLAKKRGLKIVERVIPSDAAEIITNMSVSVKSNESKFSACLDGGAITVGGSVKQGQAFLTKIGEFDVDISMDISKDVILVKQTDKPGIIAGVSSVLSKYNVNISYMTVAVANNKEAIMAIGVDSLPTDPAEVLGDIASVDGVMETTSFHEE